MPFTLQDVLAFLLGLLALSFLTVILLLVACLVGTALAVFRNGFVRLSHALVDLLARFFVIPARAILTLITPLNLWFQASSNALAYSNQYTPTLAPSSSWTGWALIGPIMYLLAFVIVAAGDFYFSALGFAALLGEKSTLPSLPFHLDVAAGLLFVVLSVIFGFILLDMWGGTPINRPWSNVNPDVLRILRIVVIGCVCLTIAAGIFFTVWRQLQLVAPPAKPAEPLNSLLPIWIWLLLAALLVAASGLSGWSIFIAPAVLFTLLLLFTRSVLYLALFPFYLLVAILNAFLMVAVGVYDLFADRGLAIWNWLSASPFFFPWKLLPLVFIQVPAVGADISQPLF